MEFSPFLVRKKHINTKIGKLYLIKVEEYEELCNYLNFLILEKKDIIKYLKTIAKKEDKYSVLVDAAKRKSFLDSIKMLGDFNFGIYEGFRDLFKLCFKEDVFNNIKNNRDFIDCIELIKKINVIKIDKANPNSEIEKFNRAKKRYDEKKNGKITFESMYTSVYLEIKEDPDKLTLYKFNALFSRIAQFKNYSTTSLFKTVSNEVEIEPWAKDIDLFAGSKKETKLKEFNKKAKSIMK